MEKQDALRVLTAQLTLIPSLKTMGRDSEGFTTWRRDTRVAIQNVFNNDDGHVKDFETIDYLQRGFFISSHTTERELNRRFYEELDEAASILKSMVTEVEEYWHESGAAQAETAPDSVPVAFGGTAGVFHSLVSRGQDVFVVHGRDEAAKEAVARFIEKLGLKAIVLHEMPNAGTTLIEKFLMYSNVGFAVVLLTPDDVGKLNDGAVGLTPRARQNVIFELGYFIGKLGRPRVCPLYVEGVELPSDYPVTYVPFDNAGGWQLLLARELKAAGLPVDLEKLI